MPILPKNTLTESSGIMFEQISGHCGSAKLILSPLSVCWFLVWVLDFLELVQFHQPTSPKASGVIYLVSLSPFNKGSSHSLAITLELTEKN
jgi:hypothetical protein